MLPSPTAYVLNVCRKMTRNHIKSILTAIRNPEFPEYPVLPRCFTLFLPSVDSDLKDKPLLSGTIK